MPAARLTEVGSDFEPGCLPAGVVTLMMRPPLRFSAGSAARVVRIAANS